MHRLFHRWHTDSYLLIFDPSHFCFIDGGIRGPIASLAMLPDNVKRDYLPIIEGDEVPENVLRYLIIPLPVKSEVGA